ncbi:MAG: phosphate signaling complex protein PhoU [Pseudomonadota bacterium]
MLHNGHIVHAFDQDLEQLRLKIRKLFIQAETQLDNALEALKNNDQALAQYTRMQDFNANKLGTEIDNDVLNIIALRQPMADDLRFLLTAVKVGVDLERVADKAKSIAKTVPLLNHSKNVNHIKIETIALGKNVQKMLTQIGQTYLDGNISKAGQLIMQDDDIDEIFYKLFATIINELHKGGIDSQNVAHFMLVIKNLERIGDHIKNIAQHTIFNKKGVYPPRSKKQTNHNSKLLNKKNETVPSCKIAIFTDQKTLGTRVITILNQAGYQAILTSQSDKTANDILHQKPDLLLLDCQHHDFDQTITTIHNTILSEELYIIAISNRDDEDLRIHVYNLGIDDFIAEPFSDKELIARVGALVRKHHRISESKINFDHKDTTTHLQLDDLWLNPTTQQIGFDDQKFDLPPREFTLLHLFMRNVDKILSRQEIIKTVWKDKPDTNKRTVDVYIKRLRLYLLKNDINYQIDTLRAHGYSFKRKTNFS